MEDTSFVLGRLLDVQILVQEVDSWTPQLHASLVHHRRLHRVGIHSVVTQFTT